MLDALIYSGLAGLATLVGISMVRWKRDWAVKYSHYVNSFAAGALITLALVHLIPESVELASQSLVAVLIAFVVFYLLETALVFHSGAAIHFADACHQRIQVKGPVVFSGLFVHSLVDGFVIAVGFEASSELGILAATGVILHELPEGVTSFALMLQSLSQKRATLLSVAIALATPVGALIAIGPFTGLSETHLGLMLAVAAGSFLYVAASDLIPESHEKAVIGNAFALLAGVGAFYLLSLLFG
jgi:ZIP family zinc transporter/zinc and cadmium transporter